ncbi:MAG: hypothetical protein AAF624_01425 [Bacteroidota bacterium]
MTSFLTRILPALLLTLFVLVGCDSSDDLDAADDIANSTGTVQVGNDAAADITGNAYAVLTSNGEFGLIIFDGAYETFGTAEVAAYTVIARESQSGIPDRGSYPISESSGFMGLYANLDASNFLNSTFINAEVGTLSITSSSSSRVVGTYTFSGELIQGQTTNGTTTVSGSFDAPIFEEDDFPDEP